MRKKMEVMEKEEAIREIESADQVNKEVNLVDEEYKSLVTNCIKKEIEYKETIDALESFGEFIVGDNEKAESELELLETQSGSVVTEENSEKDLKGAEEKDEVISSKYQAKQRELISSDENEVVAQDDKQMEKAEPEPRRSKRTGKDPFWMKDYIVEKGRGKGKK